MIRKVFLVTILCVVATTYAPWLVKTQTRPSAAAVLYEAARFIPGDGSQPITNGAMLVENGTITKIGPKGSVDVPRGAVRVDLGGKTVIPTLINTHGHPGFQSGLSYSADYFTRDAIREDLGRRPKRPGATAAAESVPRGHRRGSQARVSGECACLLSHGCCRPCKRRH